MLQHQMEIDAAEFDRAYSCLTEEQREYRRSALAADTLRQTNRGLDYHLRIQSTLERQSQCLMKQLKDLRDNFPLNVPQPLPAPDLFGTPSFPEYHSNVDEQSPLEPSSDETNPTAPEVVDNTPSEFAQDEGLTPQPQRFERASCPEDKANTVERVTPSPYETNTDATNTDETNPTLPKAA